MDRDYDLLERWRGGDVDAGSSLFRRHFEALVRFFYGKVGEEVEDLVQSTLLACVEARDRFKQQCSFRTFLFAIARNKLLRFYRARGTAATFDPAVSSLRDLATSPSGAVARVEDSSLLLCALRRVPLDFQIALELYYWEGLRPKELAVVLGVEPTTARTRLHRGRRALRLAFDELEADPERSRAALQAFIGSD